MSELKPCPFCGEIPITENNLAACANKSCPTYDNYWTDPQILTIEQWNTRPIEDALHARIAELEEKPRWIPVSERLPELGKVVVVHDANDIPYFTRQDLTYAVAVLIEKNNVKMFGFIEEFSVWYSSDVTHWMPLPTPPEVQE